MKVKLSKVNEKKIFLNFYSNEKPIGKIIIIKKLENLENYKKNPQYRKLVDVNYFGITIEQIDFQIDKENKDDTEKILSQMKNRNSQLIKDIAKEIKIPEQVIEIDLGLSLLFTINKCYYLTNFKQNKITKYGFLNK